MQNKGFRAKTTEYWKILEKGYPKKIWWSIITGPPGVKLDILQEYDVIFDEYDLRIRKLI